MSLKLPFVPKGTQEVIHYGLQRAHGSRRFTLSQAVGDGAAALIQPAAPHQVYTIGLDNLAQGQGLQAAKMVGWRAIILQGNNSVAAVEFTGDGADPKNFKSVTQGAFVQSTAEAIAAAEKMKEIKNEDFELRYLQMPSIQLMSLWLCGANQHELFIPLDPVPQMFQPNILYAESSFFKLAGILAKERSKFDNRPKNTPKKKKDDPGEEPPAAASAAPEPPLWPMAGA